MESAPSTYVRFVFPTKVTTFFDSLKTKKLLGTRCANCKTVRCPPRVDCPTCLNSGEMEWVELSGKGILLTYTVIYVAPPSFAKQAPYVVGIVQLDEGPRMMTQLIGIKPENVEIGMRVRVAFGQGAGGQPSYSFEPDL